MIYHLKDTKGVFFSWMKTKQRQANEHANRHTESIPLLDEHKTK